MKPDRLVHLCTHPACRRLCIGWLCRRLCIGWLCRRHRGAEVAR